MRQVPPQVPAATTSASGHATATNVRSLICAANVGNLDIPDNSAEPKSLSGLPTPLNVLRFKAYIQGYRSPYPQDLVKGFSEGFRLQSTLSSDPQKQQYTNHRSALEKKDIVQAKLRKELRLQRISGPFESPPFHPFILSPLGLVPKKVPNEYRLIHDLSFPKSDSVNSHIDPYYSAVRYEDLDHCLSMILALGVGTLISKADLKDAFRIIPIHPSDYKLLGFSWDGKFYYDRCLPMGCSISCQIFESFSCAIQWILTKKLDIPHMSHILDDYIFFGAKGTIHAKKSLQTFEVLAESLSLPLKHEKTVQPSTRVVLHGILVDTITMQLELPQDKVDTAKEKIKGMQHRKKVTLQSLQSLIGLLQFACRAIVPGRTFLRRLIDLTKGVQSKHLIKLSREAILDLAAWLSFLQVFNRRVLILPELWATSATLKLFSDASGHAFAAVFGAKWIQGQFPKQWVTKNIAIKELLPIVLAVRMWAQHLKNKRIMFFTDNLAIVSVINNTTSKEKGLMLLVRQLVIVSLANNILFCAKHIPGRHNRIPDMLSCSQIPQALRVAPWLDPLPTAIPAEYLPW